jgi:hypothetical protein
MTIGLHGIRFTNTPARITYNTAFPAEGQASSLLSIVVTGDGDRPLVDQFDIGPEPPSKP